jgi:hypothetical protein
MSLVFLQVSSVLDSEKSSCTCMWLRNRACWTAVTWRNVIPTMIGHLACNSSDPVTSCCVRASLARAVAYHSLHTVDDPTSGAGACGDYGRKPAAILLDQKPTRLQFFSSKNPLPFNARYNTNLDIASRLERPPAKDSRWWTSSVHERLGGS